MLEPCVYSAHSPQVPSMSTVFAPPTNSSHTRCGCSPIRLRMSELSKSVNALTSGSFFHRNSRIVRSGRVHCTCSLHPSRRIGDDEKCTATCKFNLTWEDEDNPPAATAWYNTKVRAPLMCALAHLLHSTRAALGLSKPSGRVGGHSTHARARHASESSGAPLSRFCVK